MDALVRERVVELRRRGHTYGEISEATGVPPNTAKSICRRTPTDTARVEGVCEHCKTNLPDGEQARRFCSDKCRLDWWHQHPERLNRKALYSFTCAHCGTEFMAYGNRKRKYCTHACYVQARFGTKGGRR